MSDEQAIKTNQDGKKAAAILVSMDDIPFEIPDEGQIEGTPCGPWAKGAPGPSGVPDSSDETPDDAYERSRSRQNARREAKKKGPEPPCKPGDKVTVDYGRNTTETFIVEQVKWIEAMARWEMVSTDGLYYSISQDSYRITTVVSQFDAAGIPNVPGFYMDASQTVWKFDGELFTPILNETGGIASSPAIGRTRFAKDTQGLLPLVEVQVGAE